MRLLTIIPLILAVSGGACAAAQTAAPAHACVDEVWRVVHDNFFDPGFRGVDWHAALERCHERCRGEASIATISQDINAMLAELGASHTQFYRPDPTEYYELLDIYRHALEDELKRVFASGVVRYVGIGAVMRQGARGEPTIIDAYEGGPAHSAGLLPGDVLVVADDRLLLVRANCGSPHWVLPTLAIPPGQDTQLALRIRRADALKEVTVTPRVIIPHEMFLESMRASARVIDRDGKRLAYVRIRSWAGEEAQRLLIDLVNDEPLRSCDGLILDIRGGWGGANPECISLFGCEPPTLEMINREGLTNTIEPDSENLVPIDKQWRKPVTLVVDGGTRSGKEVFAHAFKKHGRGKIVGTRTAGAVLGGKPFLLGDGSLLVVAVADVRVDGVRLEGVGVEPDIVVESPAMPSSDDPHLDRAAVALLDKIAAGSQLRGPTSMRDERRAAPHSGEPVAIFPDVSKTRSTIIFTGRVQGVGFRATTESIAERFAITGWVRNERDGSVLCVAEGEDGEVDRFIAAIKQAMGHYIHDAQVTRSPATGEYSDFSVRH